jgi:hypothetical protein
VRPRLPADAVLHADAVKIASARTRARKRVDTRRAATGPRERGKASARACGRADARPWGGNLGETLSFPYKGGRANIFPPLPTKPG